jgi:translation initiation factor 2B subunit (eIF-2B alpha/beta/delta family)
MAVKAMELLQQECIAPQQLLMLRPTMVTITNALQRVIGGESPGVVRTALQEATKEAVEAALTYIRPLVKDNNVRIATFSRSSTLLSILQKLQSEMSCEIVCSKSTPGDEGLVMAKDLDAMCVDDEALIQQLESFQLVLVGADCILPHAVVNKIGTARLAQAALKAHCPVLCCSDVFKIWNDIFPPPMEDIFEEVDKGLFTKVIVPERTMT